MYVLFHLLFARARACIFVHLYDVVITYACGEAMSVEIEIQGHTITDARICKACKTSQVRLHCIEHACYAAIAYVLVT